MKKGRIAVVLAVACLVALPMAAVAQDAPHMQRGNLDVSARGGIRPGRDFMYPGVEYIVTSIPLTKTVPLAIGATGRGLFTFGDFWNVFGAAALATAHLSFRTLELETTVLDPVDVYIGMGVSLTFWRWSAFGMSARPARISDIATVEGIRYFLNERLAIFAEYN